MKISGSSFSLPKLVLFDTSYTKSAVCRSFGNRILLHSFHENILYKLSSI